MSERARTRILHVSQPVTGGVAAYVRDLVGFQLRCGLDVVVACPPEGDLAGWVTAQGATHVVWQASRNPGPSFWLESRSLRRLVARLEPAVVHLHSSKAGLAGRVSPLGAPVVFQPHGWSFYALQGPLVKAAVVWERVAAPRARAIVCVSGGERAQAAGRSIEGPFAVVPTGVDLDRYRPAGASFRADWRSRFGVADEPLVVCVGRLHRAKGLDVLLDAWQTVGEAVPKARLAIVGEGPMFAALSERSGGSIRLVGPVDDVRGPLAAADVVVVPSRWEAMSLVLLEAMAMGSCVVATDVGGARESFPPEVHGALVPPEDPDALAKAIVARLRDPDLRAREGRASRVAAERMRSRDGAFGAVTALALEAAAPDVSA